MAWRSLRYIFVGLLAAVATGLTGIWVAKPSGVSGLVVPRGTTIQVRLNQPLSSNRNKPGDQFTVEVTGPILVAGKVAVPAGSQIDGKVVDACSSDNPAKAARLRLTLNSVTIKGKIFEIHTTDFAEYAGGYAAGNCDLSVDSPGRAGIDTGGTQDGENGSSSVPMFASAFSVPHLPSRKSVHIAADTLLKFRLIEPLVLPSKK